MSTGTRHSDSGAAISVFGTSVFGTLNFSVPLTTSLVSHLLSSLLVVDKESYDPLVLIL